MDFPNVLLKHKLNTIRGYRLYSTPAGLSLYRQIDDTMIKYRISCGKNMFIDTRTLLFNQVLNYAGENQRAKLDCALALAEEVHAGKMCDQERPYVEHVISVAEYLSRWRAPVDVILTALLHDITDPSYTIKPSLEVVRSEFGNTIAARIETIAQLSRVDPDQLIEESDSLLYDLEVEAIRLPGIVRVLHKDPIAAAVAIVDRIDKVSTCCTLQTSQRKQYAISTMNIFVPIANRLGIWTAKRDLEDGAFRLLHPNLYSEITQKYSLENRLAATKSIRQSLKSHLTRAGIPFEVSLLPISLYSIHRKLLQAEKAIPAHLLTPLLILVNSLDDCYTALKAMHQLWTPYTGQLWDYIACPKSNQYRGIHTRLRYEPGAPLINIIRTQEMHIIAEFGITAAWAGIPEYLLPKPPEWRDPPIHRIAVFTPNGDLKDLPRGATAIDFAYYVHPQIGHQCVGAIINGERCSPERVLSNGDIVEIVTNETNIGPRESWLSIVKSRKARSEIRRWFSSQGQESLAQQGWNLLDTKLREIGSTLTSAQTASRVREVALEMGYNSVSELQSALALSRLNSATVIARMQRTAENRGTQIPQAINVPHGYAHFPRRLAKCCHPLAPDAVVGYVTRRDEVVIHRTNCYLIRHLKPLLPVEWQTLPWQDAAQIRIKAEDRAGLVRDIATAVTDADISMSHFHADRVEDNVAIITMDLDRTTLQQSKLLLDHIREIESIKQVEWANVIPKSRIDPSRYFQIPYTISPVTGTRFFGRDVELQKIANFLHDPNPGNAILVWGPRRIGKTSLLRQLEMLLMGNLYLPAFLDMQSISGQDTTVFLYRIAKQLATTIANPNVTIPKFNHMRRDPLGYFHSFLNSLRGVENRHIIVILDEIQVLTSLREERVTLADSFAYMRSLITGSGQLSFLFCGGGVIDTLQEQVGASSLLNVTYTQKVDCLPAHEARRLIIEPAQHFSYDDDVVDELLDLTSGHPYYLQMLCGELVLSAYNSGGMRVRRGHLSNVLEEWLPVQEEHHYSHLWGTDSIIDPKIRQQNKLLITAVSTSSQQEDRWLSFENLCTTLVSTRIPESELWQRLQALAKMDTLEFDGAAHFRVKIPLCQEWINANYSISRILRDIP